MCACSDTRSQLLIFKRHIPVLFTNLVLFEIGLTDAAFFEFNSILNSITVLNSTKRMSKKKTQSRLSQPVNWTNKSGKLAWTRSKATSSGTYRRDPSDRWRQCSWRRTSTGTRRVNQCTRHWLSRRCSWSGTRSGRCQWVTRMMTVSAFGMAQIARRDR